MRNFTSFYQSSCQFLPLWWEKLVFAGTVKTGKKTVKTTGNNRLRQKPANPENKQFTVMNNYFVLHLYIDWHTQRHNNVIHKWYLKAWFILDQLTPIYGSTCPGPEQVQPFDMNAFQCIFLWNYLSYLVSQILCE